MRGGKVMAIDTLSGFVDQMSGSTIVLAIHGARRPLPAYPEGLSNLRAMSWSRNRRLSDLENPVPFSDLLSITRDLSAKFSVDKIYEMYGLANDSLQRHIPVDKKESLTDVSIALVRYLLSLAPNLRLLT